MKKKLLHITNGDGLAERIENLSIPGGVIIWRELLCQGPTLENVGSNDFVKSRKKFLKDTYLISEKKYETRVLSEFKKLQEINDIDEIILWFEFDLFCHINMLAVINYLIENKHTTPIYLVCSKNLKGESGEKGLIHLKDKEFLNHYQCKIHLNDDDLELANLIWLLYCGNNPQKLKSNITQTSNFEYLSSCMRAHLERFPNIKSGLNSLESNILQLIDAHKITSHNQLLGYALEYQGYYGYNDTQMLRLLDKLSPFYHFHKKHFALTSQGELAFHSEKNFYREMKDHIQYGGTMKYDFLYNDETHNLLKL